MKIEFEVDEQELNYAIKEVWYKQGKKHALNAISNVLEKKIPTLVEDYLKSVDLSEEIEKGIDRALDRYNIREIVMMKKAHKKP